MNINKHIYYGTYSDSALSSACSKGTIDAWAVRISGICSLKEINSNLIQKANTDFNIDDI